MKLPENNIRARIFMQMNRATRKQINSKSIMRPIIKEMERRPE